jgi:GAF domain-containing protein
VTSSWVSLGKSSNSCTCRTSITSSSHPGQRLAHSTASSLDFPWIIQYPPNYFFGLGKRPVRYPKLSIEEGNATIGEEFPRNVPAGYFSNTIRRLAAGEDVYFSNETEMEQLEVKRAFRRSGIKAFLATPLRGDHQFLGALSLSNHEKEMAWPADFVSQLHVIAAILGNAVERKLAAQALQESESLTSSILESLRSNVAVVDNKGTILEVNQHWLDLRLGKL